MSDAVIIAMLVAVPPTLVGVAGLIQSIWNGRKADQTNLKAEEIHVLVNGNMAVVKAELVRANERIEKLEALLLAHQPHGHDT